MNARELKKKLGMDPGATLIALVDLAERVSPSAPWDAFAPLWLHLPWLEKGKRADEMRHLTPKNVHPFAETGGDLNHFGFLLDRDVPTDERPIVYVVPKDDDEATTIVAPNLRAFLGLVAVADGEVISRSATDADWATFRRKSYGDDAATLAEMDRLSTLLCSIPGVERPASPSRVANAYPNQAFELYEDIKAPDGEREALRESVRAARDRVMALASGMVNGQVLHGERLTSAKAEATASLTLALDALFAVDENAAIEFVSGWRDIWSFLERGVSGDLETHLNRYMRKRQ